MATKNKIMLDCLRQLSMVYGTSVNTYAQDKLYSMIDDAIETTFKDRFWQRHIKKLRVDLSDGYCTREDFNKVCREFEDIQTIVTDTGYPRELQKANFSVVPNMTDASTPLSFQYAYEEPSKVFRCIPPGTGTVWVIFRTLCRPNIYQKFLNNQTIVDAVDRQFETFPEDEVPFDALAIKYKACHSYMVIKGDNNLAVANFDRLYNERINKLIDEETNNKLSYFNGVETAYSNGWYDHGWY